MPTQIDFSGRTFGVDSVVPGNKPLQLLDVLSHLQRWTGHRILAISAPDLSVNALGYHNALIDAVSNAYAQHLPLVLSPDAIWLTIAQSFGHHIRQNAEHFRGRLVQHQGKQTLEIVAADWVQAVSLFSSRIRAATDSVIHDTLVCDFSTTTPAIRIASEVVLMDTYAEYFDHRFVLICGIPRITLQGTPEDWRRIRDRIEVLDTFELEWWTSRLRPILDEFINTAEGNPTSSFWSSIYTAEPVYGSSCMPSDRVTGERITGWIADLFPYLGDRPGMRRNPALAQPRISWTQPSAGVVANGFPSGLCEVDVEATMNGITEAVKFRAGFLGVCQNAADLAVTPVIGWAVTRNQSKEEAQEASNETILRRLLGRPRGRAN